MKIENFFTLLSILSIVPVTFAQLRVGFYNNSCPSAETIVRNLVSDEFKSDPTITAALLRMNFHDCFVGGCDGSILLNSTDSERFFGPNLSVRGFELIDEIKTELEAQCPSNVSCADIMALATRDSVVLAGGPNYNITTGRRDGLKTNASGVFDLIGPTASVAAFLSFFGDKTMTTLDAVALLGAHTVGVGSCGLFRDRLTNFNGTGLPDPSMDSDLVAKSTPLTFDNAFFGQIRARRGVLQLDQRLATDEATSSVVAQYAADNDLFKRQFAIAMVKLGAVNVLTGEDGEIRTNCWEFNKN
ncbi:hem peroxidase superfamily [Arabidopsis thaliana x Arabidopsis arenosa]|uniref:peroxidase n=1 Tax=Arabidopsis thaliana x Arabidopsis arenosa TaxID=1240361 RepID=A0A8T2AMX0_9BRAS|nr:hem peroxidase superfamily [Arabidopsis thaliana x Arabidopsis arenosa]